MISQPDVLQPNRGAFADLRRGLTIADLKANVVDQTVELPIRNGVTKADGQIHSVPDDDVPELQTVLLLYQPKTRYALTPKHTVPELRHKDEVLIKIEYIGLNPIDWKAPDFGWGIPKLPYISGRDFLGTIVRSSSPSRPVGAQVLAISTDYRDERKSAFQHYAVSATHTICPLPSRQGSAASGPDPSHASLGVAFTAAALALGVCLGVDFSPATSGASSGGFDFLNLLRSRTSPAAIPHDVRAECLDGIHERERARPGDWVAIWGGGSTTALMLTQLAKAAGLRVALVGDAKKHGGRVVQRGLAAPDVMVDCWDEDRAVEVLRGVAGGRLRYAVDAVGKETAGKLAEALADGGGQEERVHLVGLSGAPKNVRDGIVLHTVPIKVFHEVREVGLRTMEWLARLLSDGRLVTPDVEVVEGGLRSVNGALDRMRKNEVSGKRLVVRV
ncbi:uncharacterized protein J3D65DRAFT_614415 [Phyllosticta citribraziliensis]|uniref:Alcohol dehydrogenase-like N-terminal domain-containing protein n=1 Tax=Phyllosticta citribraziliensis TaxID=989973 RepID=A0ABR1M4V1_9PEZI